jgi:hypothetical protein
MLHYRFLRPTGPRPTHSRDGFQVEIHVRHRPAQPFSTLKELQAELHRLREESEQKDAANEGLDDRRFDAEVALANDRRAFEIAQNELLEWSREAEARSRHKENLLTEALAQMAKDREEYQLTISARPEADFLLLRVVGYQASRILIRDKILSVDGADELLKQLELAKFPNFPLTKTLAIFSIISLYPDIHINTVQEHAIPKPSTKASRVDREDTLNQAELFQGGRVLGQKFLERGF